MSLRVAPYDRAIREKQCRSIRIAEEQLAAGRSAFLRCFRGCEGLCCRNLEIDAVIGFSDFVYLLTVERQLQESISICLEHEKKVFYTGDCVFLINGKGPCIFPQTSRPEVCITTFCYDVEPVKQEIRCVKLQFMKLNFYLLFLQFKTIFRHVKNKS